VGFGLQQNKDAMVRQIAQRMLMNTSLMSICARFSFHTSLIYVVPNCFPGRLK
jgi:hypothetical protein